MVIASKAATIGVIFVSLAMGVLLYYFLYPLPKKERKKYTDELVSQLVNLVLLIWLGKVLLNLSLFIEDPLAVLAYPGDSHSFYLAILFTAGIVLYKTFRSKLDLYRFVEGFIYVFLIALFFYEFLQLVLEDGVFSFGYLILSAALYLLSYVLYGRVRSFYFIMIMLFGWTAGLLILNTIYPYLSLFGYLMSIEFIIVFFILCAGIFILYERKGKA
jgi:hypothetical protein